MQVRTYKVSELRKIVKESHDEFKPVLGKNVESDNKKNNEKAYKDSAKKAKDYDGGAKEDKKNILNYSQDDNYGMENLEYDNTNEKFIKDNKSRLKGYVDSRAEELHKNDDFGNATHTDQIKGMKEKADALKNGRVAASEIGLTGRETDKKEIEKQHKTIFDESKMNRLTFKNTVFLTEKHMMSRIPDSYKVEGKQFIMCDKANHEYLVEWHVEDEPNVLNRTKINEEQARIKELFGYKSGMSNTTQAMRLNENNNVNSMLDKARSLMK